MNSYWRKAFGWSKSRQGLLEDCPLAYYYNYIGRYEYGKEADSITPLLKLQKFPFFKGSLIHSAIRNQITQHCLARPISLEAAKNYISLEFKKILSAQGKYITEAYNGFAYDNDALIKENEDALSQITNFFTVIWHNYKGLKFLTHERLENFSLEGHKVWVQPDLVTKNHRGELMISDWKTGKSERACADTDLQLSVYILWASLYFSCDVKDIGAELVYLKTTQGFPSKRSPQRIEETKVYILQESKKMLAAKDRHEFIPCPKFHLCKGCNFATICPEAAIK